jgi:hypothetical protein
MKTGPDSTPTPAPAAEKERTFITLDPAVAGRYAGTYRLGELQVVIAIQDGKLVGAPVGEKPDELKPITSSRFYATGIHSEVEFIPQPGGGMTLKLSTPGGLLEGQRLKPSNPRNLPQYPGTYWSEELETQYTFVLKDGKLFAEHAHHGEISLQPQSEDDFRGSTWFMSSVKFTRDAAGTVDGVILGGGRITGIRFTRRGAGTKTP